MKSFLSSASTIPIATGTDSSFPTLKIKMIMVAATGVECSFAERAAIITLQVPGNAHFGITCTTYNSLIFKFIFLPGLCFVASFFVVAIDTGIIAVAAFHLNGNDIQR